MHRHLSDAVHFLRLWQTDSFQDSWRNVGAMSELAAHSAFVLDAFRPANHHRVADAAEMRRDLLPPLKWCIPCPRPCRGVVRVHVGAAPFIQAPIRLDRFYLLVSSERNAV